MSTLACDGCGRAIDSASPTAFRCPNACTDGADHVVVRTLDAASVSFPSDGAANPFERYRALTHAYALARSRGMNDAAFTTLVRELDASVANVCGRGFVATPCRRSDALSAALGLGKTGGLWVKDETHNVSGSHKGRHLMGLAILGDVCTRLGMAPAPPQRLAIASCGNAALAAAVVARAWKRTLEVFIPPDANPAVVAQLEKLGARIVVCRRATGMKGDPCVVAFRAAVDQGAYPFCCQGSENGLAIEGGETLGWELISEGFLSGPSAWSRLFVQVGGGALASACVRAFDDAVQLGVAVTRPKIHAVQTRGAFPLRRAWERVTQRIAERLGFDARADDSATAARIHAEPRTPGSVVHGELVYAARHRAEFMWPWESEPKSVAHGILDDETYDWLAVVRGMIATGGWPVVVDEERVIEANRRGRADTGIDVDETGSAGLAGAIELSAAGAMARDEAVGVLFTGVKR